jgi:protoheme IX farnesyltransferase
MPPSTTLHLNFDSLFFEAMRGLNISMEIKADRTITMNYKPTVRSTPPRNQRLPRSLLELAKPRIVFLIAYCGGASILVASRFASPSVPFTIALISFILGSAGCNAVTSYIDRDIDAVMERTRKRPIPEGRTTPRQALAYGAMLTVGGISLSWFLGPVIFVIGLLGVLDNVVVYSLLSKRRTTTNIILGSFSGAAPVLIGWVLARGAIDLMGIIIASLVVLWIPNHIWSLALYYADDYRKAGVPMLPAMLDMKKAARCIVSTVFLLIAFSLLPFALGFLGETYLLISMPFTVVLAAGNLWLALRPSKKLAWRMFKISSPYLFILFFAMMLDQLPHLIL